MLLSASGETTHSPPEYKVPSPGGGYTTSTIPPSLGADGRPTWSVGSGASPPVQTFGQQSQTQVPPQSYDGTNRYGMGAFTFKGASTDPGTMTNPNPGPFSSVGIPLVVVAVVLVALWYATKG